MPKKKVKKVKKVKSVKKTKAAKKKKIIKKIKPIKKGPKALGKVTHFFDRISVAIIKTAGTIKVGDFLRFLGKTGEFVQQVDSIQINHKNVPVVNKGAEIGIKVDQEAKVGSLVFPSSEKEAKPKFEYQPIIAKPANKILPPGPAALKELPKKDNLGDVKFLNF